MADNKRRPEVPLAMEDDKTHRRLLAQRANASLPRDGSDPMTEPLVLASYTVAGVPTASLWTQGLIYVSNETGGAVVAFSDGVNWRRCTDRAIIA